MIKLNKFLLFFAIVMLPNAVPINLSMQGTPLVIWKQAISILLLFLFFPLFDFYKRSLRIPAMYFFKKWVIMTIVLSFLLVIYTFFQGISPLRLMYALIAYVGFLPFLLLPFICIYDKSEKQLIKILASIGTFCGFGLIFDYFFNVFDWLLPITGGSPSFEFWSQRFEGGMLRATFFFEAPSNIYTFLSLSMLSLFFMIYSSRKLTEKIILSVGIVGIWGGLILTGARAQVIIGSIFILVALLGLIWYSKSKTNSIILSVVSLSFLIFAASYIINSSEQQEMIVERQSNPFSTEDDANVHRFGRWNEGLKLFGSLGIELFLGYGIGTTMGQMAEEGDTAHTHYESSFFQAFYEGGFIALFLRYSPGILIIYFLMIKIKKWSYLDYLIFIWVLSYFSFIFASPAASAYHGQMAYYILLSLSAVSTHYAKIFNLPFKE